MQSIFLTLVYMMHATTAVALSLEELVQRADTFIQGEVMVQKSFWQGSRIYTLSTVRVDEVWIGPAIKPYTIDVLTLGGVVHDIGQQVDGAAVLPEKQRVVLALKNQSGEYVPVGMAQGAWFIQQPSNGNPHALVSRPYIDRLIHMHQGDTPFPNTLDALKKAVLEVARAP